EDAGPVVPALIAHLEEESARELLIGYGGEATGALIAALEGASKRQRDRIFELLGELPRDAEQVVPALVANLKDEAARELLLGYGSQAQVALASALPDAAPAERRLILDLLETLPADTEHV